MIREIINFITRSIDIECAYCKKKNEYKEKICE